MKLRSPDETPVHVALLNGRAIVIGPQGREVPEEFRAEAFMRGAIPVVESQEAPDPVVDEPVRTRKKKGGAEGLDESTFE